MTRVSVGLVATTLTFLGVLIRPAPAMEPPEDEPWLHPYAGPSRSDVDATTLDGKVLCGYQGWFNTPCDGTSFGFTHWGQGLNRPGGGRFTVDMWPDVSEYAAEDLCDVPGLKLPDGSPARLYSAYRKGPVLLHTKWMRQYGIDGVFLSRFIGEAASPTRSRHVNRVLASVREGCHREGRVWAMMLDLSAGATTRMVIRENAEARVVSTDTSLSSSTTSACPPRVASPLAGSFSVSTPSAIAGSRSERGSSSVTVVPAPTSLAIVDPAAGLLSEAVDLRQAQARALARRPWS